MPNKKPLRSYPSLFANPEEFPIFARSEPHIRPYRYTENKKNMDKIVEIARFTYPAEAQTLMALLRSEGIECYLRNEFSSQLMAGYIDVGGARVEILESDVPRALQIMKEGGYELPAEDSDETGIEQVAGWTSRIPFLKKYPLEKQILLFFLLIAVLLALFICLGSFFSAS